MKVNKTTSKPRRKPAQSRSSNTVDCILEASAHILVSEGQGKLNTNHIAKIAGVSVGSIYQYFGNKETILAELGNRHIDEMLTIIMATLQKLPSLDLKEALETMVHAVMDAHKQEPQLHQVLVRELNKLDGYTRVEELDGVLLNLTESFLKSRAHEISSEDLKLASFVVMQTIENLTHQGVLFAPQIDLSKLTKECSHMLYCYLTG